MSCKNAQELISLLLDGKVPAGDRESVLAHTGVFRECGTHLESAQMQRVLLRRMAQTPVPDALAAKLRVMASHARERQLARVSVRVRARRLAANINLMFDNLMRPVALPLTGGLLSTLSPIRPATTIFPPFREARSSPLRGKRAWMKMRWTFPSSLRWTSRSPTMSTS